MTTRTKIELVIGAIVLVGLILLAVSWIEARDAQTKAETLAAAEQKIVDANQAQMKTLEAQAAASQAQAQAQLSALEKRFDQANTPQQIAGVVSQLMGLKQPVQIVTPAPTAANPNPQPVAQVATSDAPQVKAYVEACEACKVQLPAAQKQIESLTAQTQLASSSLAEMQKERDQWKTAAKGSWRTNLKRAAKFIAIGAAVGTATVCGTGHCK